MYVKLNPRNTNHMWKLHTNTALRAPHTEAFKVNTISEMDAPRDCVNITNGQMSITNKWGKIQFI